MQLIRADEGEIILDGDSVAMSRSVTLRDYRRSVQMVFQDSYASRNPRLSLQDTIAFGPRPTGVSQVDAMRRAHDMLQRVGLAPEVFASRFPHELSGGLRQRAMIALALSALMRRGFPHPARSWAAILTKPRSCALAASMSVRAPGPPAARSFEMSDNAPFITDDARRFAQRYGMTKLRPEDMPTLASPLDKMAEAGLAVTRAPSRFNAPAHVFKVRSTKP